jgi:hypothetical protein
MADALSQMGKQEVVTTATGNKFTSFLNGFKNLSSSDYFKKGKELGQLLLEKVDGSKI